MLKKMNNVFFKYLMPILIWTYVLVKLFVFDIDNFLLEAIDPRLLVVVKFKFLIFIAIISILLIKVKSMTLLKEVTYLIFFPILVFVWFIPKMLYEAGNLNLVIGFIDGFSSMFVSFKYNFITFTFFAISFVSIFTFQNKIVLYASALIVTVLIFAAYVRRMYFVFRPTSLFSFAKKAFTSINKHTAATYVLQDELKSISVPNMNEVQLKKWIETLQNSVLYNRAFLFAARKLRSYQQSGLNLVAYMVMIFTLVALTVLSFSAINYALYTADTSSFNVANTPSFFTFFYYSFNNFVFNSITEIIPTGKISQIALMVEQFFVAFLLANIASLIFSFRSQKSTEELEEIIKDMERESEKIESIIKSDYNLPTIEDAILELEKAKSGSISIIIALTNGLK